MEQPLVPIDTLRAHDAEIRAATERSVADHGLCGDSSYEIPFRYYTVFSGDGLASKVGLGELTPVARFYNTYYWFKRFVSAHVARHGDDAGLEQQAYQLLEKRADDIDWATLGAVVARLESLV